MAALCMAMRMSQLSIQQTIGLGIYETQSQTQLYLC